jgi:hypothetical protein
LRKETSSYQELATVTYSNRREVKQTLQLGRIRHFHAAILGVEFGERALAQAMLAAHLRCRHPGFLLFEHPNDLRLGETALTH